MMRFFSKVTCAILKKWVALHNADESQFTKALEAAKIKTAINNFLNAKRKPKVESKPISKHRNIYDPAEKPW